MRDLRQLMQLIYSRSRLDLRDIQSFSFNWFCTNKPGKIPHVQESIGLKPAKLGTYILLKIEIFSKVMLTVVIFKNLGNNIGI